MSLKSQWKGWSREERKNLIGAIVVSLALIWFIGGLYILGHFIVKYW